MILRLIILIIFVIQNTLCAQNQAVTGWVFNKQTLENIPSAVIVDVKTNLYTESNIEGYYQLLTSKGDRELWYAAPGFKSQRVQLSVSGVVFNNVFLEPLDFDEIDSSALIVSLYTSKTSFYSALPRQIYQYKSLFGISDPIKLFQFLPGVSGGIEGLSSTYVRGSNSDQNLILMNGLPLYGNGHIWGLLSNFNPDVISTAEMYRGVSPARFGNRAGGGVIDILTRGGNAEKWSGNFNVDLATASLAFDGPIDQKGKITMAFAYRRSYLDLLLISLAPELNETLVGNIHDVNFKINYKKNKQEHLNFWFYNGRDKYGLNFLLNSVDSVGRSIDVGLKFGWQWQNTLMGANYFRELNKRHFIHSSIGYSRYSYLRSELLDVTFSNTISPQNSFISFEESNSITDYSFNNDLEYLLGTKTKLRYGTHWVTHHMKPGVLKFSEKINTREPVTNEYGLANNQFVSEWSSYGELDFHSDNYLNINIGTRLWTYFGRDNRFIRVEPRITLNQRLDGNKRFQIGASVNNQGIHQLSSVTGILPQDVWFPTSGRLKPQQTTQFSAAYISPLKEGIELSFEVYYKYFDGLMYLQESRDEKLSKDYWEQMINQGTGSSSGFEVLLTKKSGQLNIIASYTYSTTTRLFKDVNGGEAFPFRWDRPHKLAIQMVYQVNPSFNFNFNAMYMSGNPVTVPTGRYFTVDNRLVYDFSAINNYRLPTYQRIDFGFTKEIKPELHFETREYYGVHVYNILGEINPVNAQFEFDSNNQLKLMGNAYFTFVPSVFYRIEF
jgi:hypothetical protein